MHGGAQTLSEDTVDVHMGDITRGYSVPEHSTKLGQVSVRACGSYIMSCKSGYDSTHTHTHTTALKSYLAYRQSYPFDMDIHRFACGAKLCTLLGLRVRFVLA